MELYRKRTKMLFELANMILLIHSVFTSIEKHILLKKKKKRIL